jgi:hypothetical protein
MNRVTRSVEDASLLHAHCRFCHQEIVDVADIGWLDPTPGDTYDLCPASAYGEHRPIDGRPHAHSS